MEELNFSYEQPRVKCIEIDISHFPDGAYFFSISMKRCMMADLLHWSLKLGPDSSWNVSMHPDGLLEVLSSWQTLTAYNRNSTACTTTCLEIHRAISCIMATVFNENVSLKQVYQTARDFVITHKHCMTEVCFSSTKRFIDETLLQEESTSGATIGLPKYGVTKLAIDVSDLPVSCITFDISFQRCATMERIKVIPTSCRKVQHTQVFLRKGIASIKPTNSSICCKESCINVGQMLHEVYCKKKPKTLTEVSLLMQEMKALLFIHGTNMDKLCYEHTLSNMITMKQIFEKQAAVKKHFLV
jgi:hypothetical protein